MSKDTTERNARIVAFYNGGSKKLTECAREFGLGRQRILQILKAAGAWVPYAKGTRTKFLGVSVSDDAKEGLQKLAKDRGTSASKLASDAIDKMLEEAK